MARAVCAAWIRVSGQRRDRVSILSTRIIAPRALPALTRGQWLLAAVGLVAGYYLLGLAGLQLQSGHIGVTPVWPGSGLAFAMAYWFGMSLLIAVLPAMLLLAITLGIPIEVATISALGSMLEAGVPVYLMHRLGMDPRLNHLRDALLFIVLGPLLGPLFSAVIGVLAYQMLDPTVPEALRIGLLWWLGNSVGFLLLGGFGLVVVARRSLRVSVRAWFEIALAAAGVVVITALGMFLVTTISSPLILYLLIPVFVLIGQRGDLYPVFLLAVIALAVLLLSGSWLPPESLAQTDLGILYLDVGLLWVIVFTGMLSAIARQEMQEREAVTWLLRHDPLTRLLNRHALMNRLEELLQRRCGGDVHSVLMFLDLDRFKDLNDAEGHRAGDQVLREISALLLEEIRAADTAARLGGDEFAILLEDCALLDACSMAENIRSTVERYEYPGRHARHRLEVSIGLVELNDGHASPEDALSDGELACYDAKRGGRNRVCVHTGDDAAAGGPQEPAG